MLTVTDMFCGAGGGSVLAERERHYAMKFADALEAGTHEDVSHVSIHETEAGTHERGEHA